MAALALAACSGGPGAACLDDAECTDGLYCFAGVCEEPGAPEPGLVFQVIPPEASALQPVLFPYGEQPLRFGVCGASGIAGALGEGRERAAVIAEGALAGLPGERHVERFEVGGAFTLPLPAGAWRLTFLLDGEPPPPPVVVEEQVARCELARIEEPVAPPPGGRVLRFTLVVDETADPRAVCGAALSVHDPATGRALSRRLVAEDGCPGAGVERVLAFAEPSAEAVELRIEPADLDVPALPTLRLLRAVGEDDVFDAGAIGLFSGTGPLERVLVSAVDDAARPVARARVVAAWRAEAPTPEAPVQRGFAARPAVELAPGLYELWLVPGRYAIRVEPPWGSPLAATSCLGVAGEDEPCADALELPPGGGGLRLLATLAPKPLLRGTVRAAGGERVASAVVSAIPAAGGRRPSVASDRRGRYELPVDPGAYEVLVQPSAPNLPWRRIALEEEVRSDRALELALPASARVLGYVEAQGPLGGSLVRAYRVEEERAVLVGEAIADEDGRFSFALPAAE